MSDDEATSTGAGVHDDLRSEFHHELDEIRETIAKLSAAVTETIPRATQILLAQDLEGAEYMILGDDEIDARSLELEERCYPLLALQAPVAGDLRQIVVGAADHRRGRALGRPRRQHLQGGPADLRAPARPAAARDHPADGRPGAAAVQGGHRGLRRRATPPAPPRSTTWTATSTTCSASSCRRSSRATPADKIDLQVAVQLAVVARFYERIGDHAVNIGERVRYVVTGWVPEHDGRGPVRHACRGERPGLRAAWRW